MTGSANHGKQLWIRHLGKNIWNQLQTGTSINDSKLMM